VNGGPNSTLLGTWLASNYSNLFGNLSGQPNSVVASEFESLVTKSSTSAKLYLQVFTTALSLYMTDSNQTGGTPTQFLPTNYGFKSTPGGSGSATYNTETFGTLLGLPNHTPTAISAIVAAANSEYLGGCWSGNLSTKTAQALCVGYFGDDINQAGDIR
jgi:hypothetical protein